MRVTVRTALPETEPLTAAELNTFLGTGFATTAEGEETPEADLKLGPVIKEARSLAEKWSGRSLLTQAWELSLEPAGAAGLGRAIKLSHGPVSAINAVGVAVPGEESLVEMDPESYTFRAGRDEVVLLPGKSWPVMHAGELLVVDYDAGVDDAEDLDPGLVRLVKELAALLWRHRGDGFVQGVDSFLDNPDVTKLLAKFADYRVDGSILVG